MTTATDVPTGRQVISGVIVVAWHWEGEHGQSIKIKVNCGEFQVRGTCPKSLIDESLPRGGYSADDYWNLPRALNGQHVTLTATLRPDNREIGQGFFARPAKAAFTRHLASP